MTSFQDAPDENIEHDEKMDRSINLAILQQEFPGSSADQNKK